MTVGDDQNVGLIFLTQRARKKNDLHAGYRRATGGHHRPKCPSTHQEGIKLTEECGEIEVGVRRDPISFTIRPSNITIQAHRYAIPNAPHDTSYSFLEL
jgi:hypothetical protein